MMQIRVLMGMTTKSKIASRLRGMEILWLAIVFYSVGLATVLHFRPSLMFRDDGTWKEFGYQRGGPVYSSRYTIFPFWLFAVAWAFVSYAMAAAIAWGSTDAAMMGTTAVASMAYSLPEPEPDIEYEMEPVSRSYLRNSRGRFRPSVEEADLAPPPRFEQADESVVELREPPRKNQPRPGYYVVDPSSTEGGGLRRYIYYGPNPPTQ